MLTTSIQKQAELNSLLVPWIISISNECDYTQNSQYFYRLDRRRGKLTQGLSILVEHLDQLSTKQILIFQLKKWVPFLDICFISKQTRIQHDVPGYLLPRTARSNTSIANDPHRTRGETRAEKNVETGDYPSPVDAGTPLTLTPV